MKTLKREGKQKFNEKESVNFLIAEFNQSFEQLRHYDKIQSSLINFSLTGYTAIFSLSYAIYEFVKDYNFKFTILSLLLIISSFMGFILLLSFVRNRLYYTVIAKQINSLRNYFLNNSKLNYIKFNKSYLSPDNPKNYNIWSTDSIYIYLISLLNSILLGSGVFIIIFFIKNKKYASSWILSILLIIIIFSLELFVIIRNLSNKDEKSADEITFGLNNEEGI